MFTLKIHWYRYEQDDVVGGITDETTLFIPADQVRVHAQIDAGMRESAMKHWDRPDSDGYHNYLSIGKSGGENGGRLICAVHNGVQTWYLATNAWVLGPNGDTIERVAP